MAGKLFPYAPAMNDDHSLSAYDYHLPEELIAQAPCPDRDRSRLMILPPGQADPLHARFRDLIEYLRAGDVLVRNDTRVFPARLLGRKESGGRCEVLLLEYPSPAPGTRTGQEVETARCLALVRSSRRPRPGTRIVIGKDLWIRVENLRPDAKVEVSLHASGPGRLDTLLERHGQVPLPPYIRRPDGSTDQDRERYQTRYARHTGSVAAPTAGLHFSDHLLEEIRNLGVETCSVTLHVGYGTFAPVRSEDIRQHRLHRELVRVGEQTVRVVNRALAEGRRIWAVGTTTVRTLEFAADEPGHIRPVSGPCDLYITPGFRFRVVDNLITNFHLPRSSLLFLVSALAGRKRILAAYREAVTRGYRFFSYGDAMALIRK